MGYGKYGENYKMSKKSKIKIQTPLLQLQRFLEKFKKSLIHYIIIGKINVKGAVSY